MGQDSGGGGLQIDNFEEGLSALKNVAVNYMTAGLVGTENGKLTKGFTTRGVDESVGEVTGRNAARKQIMEGKDAIDRESAAKAKELKDDQDKKQRQDVDASNYASSVRRTASIKEGLALGNPTQDFLGL